MAETQVLPDRRAAAQLEADKDMADAMARKAESMRNILRDVRRQEPEESKGEFDGPLSEAEKTHLEMLQRREEVFGQTAPKDPEGTAPTLADRAGNFAPNQEVASVGGIGVDASNSVANSDQQAQNAQEAGTVGPVQPAVAPQMGAKIIGETRVDDPNTPGDESADIPEDWESMHFQQRRSLAMRLSGGRVRTGEEADDIIRAEVDRRS